jgi:RimJ/RimL family protein N-acetyltransferase
VIEMPAAAVPEFFAPERPGPLVHAQILVSGVGVCRADRWPAPQTVVAELPGGNIAVRGAPHVLPLVGLVDAPADWLPVLREIDPGTGQWPRIVAGLAGQPRMAAGPDVRPLRPDDAAALAGLDPSIDWISETWGGPVGLAASGRAWAAFDGDVPVSVACSFYVGSRHEDVGVVTAATHRGRGLARACAQALALDIRDRGRLPTWTTSPDNTASRAVAHSLGFVPVREDVLYAVNTPVPTLAL